MALAGKSLSADSPITHIGHLLALLRAGELEERRVAAEITTLLAHLPDEGGLVGPALDSILEQASALELPPAFTSSRAERWACIEALLAVAAAFENAA